MNGSRAYFAVLRLDTLAVHQFETIDEAKNAIIDLESLCVPVVVLRFHAISQCYAVQKVTL